MVKFCPKCGVENSNNAKFCKNCGYDFSQRNDYVDQNINTTSSRIRSRDRLRSKQDSKAYYIIIISIIIILLIEIAFLLFNPAKRNESSTTTNSSSPRSSNSLSSSSNSYSSAQLSFGSHPKQDAASIICYAKENNLTVGKDQSSSYHVRLDSDNDVIKQLSEPGQEMAYEFYTNQNTHDGGPFLIYTVEKDNTVNIYTVSSIDSDHIYDPSKRISGASIDNYLNNHNDYSEVKNTANLVNIEQDN